MATMGCGALRCGGAGQGAGTRAEQRAWPTHSTGLRPPSSALITFITFCGGNVGREAPPHGLIFFSLVPL